MECFYAICSNHLLHSANLSKHSSKGTGKRNGHGGNGRLPRLAPYFLDLFQPDYSPICLTLFPMSHIKHCVFEGAQFPWEVYSLIQMYEISVKSITSDCFLLPLSSNKARQIWLFREEHCISGVMTAMVSGLVPLRTFTASESNIDQILLFLRVFS